MGIRVIKFFAIGAAILSVALVLVLALVMAGAFRQSAAGFGLWAAGGAAGYEFACEEFEGRILTSFTCHGFSASDDQGAFFRAGAIEFGWHFLSVLSRYLNVEYLRVADAELSRKPIGEDSGEAAALPNWPAISITLGELTLQRFVVNLPGTPTVCLNGAGSSEIAEPVLNLDMQFARCGGEGTGTALARVEDGQIDIDVQISDDGDLAALILNWEGAGATNVRLVGAGPLNAFSGSLEAQIENGGNASLDVVTLATGDNAVDGIGIAGEIILADGRAPGWAPATSGSVSAQVFFGEQGALRVENGMFIWGNAEVDFVFLRSEVGALSAQLEANIGPYDGAVAFQSAELSLNLQGDDTAQIANADYALEEFCAEEICATSLEGSIELTNENSNLVFMTQGVAQMLGVTENLDEVLGEEVNYNFSGTYARDNELLNVEGVLQGMQGDLALSSQMSFADGFAGSALAWLEIEENAVVGDIVIPAALSLSAQVEEFIADGPISGTIGLASDILDGSGRFALSEDETLDFAFETARSDAVLLSEWTGYNFTAPPSFRAAVSGSFEMPVVTVEAFVPALDLGGFSLTDMQWNLEARRFEGAWMGESALSSQSSAGMMDINARLNWPDEAPVEIAVAESHIAEALVAGSFTLPPGEAPAAGMFNLTGNVLSPLGQYFAQPVASNGAAGIELRIGGDTPSVAIELALEEVSFGEQLRAAGLEGDLTYDIAARHADANLRLSEGMDTLSLEAGADFGDETLITLRLLDGSWAGTPFRLLEPASLHSAMGTTTLNGAAFAVGDGRAEISGYRNAEGLETQIILASIPVEPVMDLLQDRPEAQGEINANLNARLTPTVSEGQFTLSLDEFAFANIAREFVPADVAMNGNWDGTELTINGELSGLDEVPAVFSASVPLRRAGEGYAVAIQDNAPISGMFSGSARAERFLAILPIAEHSLTGLISASLQLDGTPAEPHFTGQARLQNGTYESLELGTRLEEFNLTLDATTEGALSLEADATDGGAGRLTANGSISFDDNAEPIGNANINITNAYIVRRDEYTVRGSGEISFDFPETAAARIGGMFTTSEVRVDLGRPLPPGIEQIDVVEINRPAELGAMAQDEESQAVDFISEAALDIEIAMPNNLRVVGYGVNAEWQGNITIAGTVGTPIIGGEINLIRGFAEFLGRQFILDEGSVIPASGAEGSARIDISGSHAQNDLNVEVNISGPAASPEITWSSVPALPRDEIISRLYFGRASPQLSAYEAIQLAQLSGALGGLGGPGGVLGFARRVAGLDVLRIEPPQGGDIANPTVTVGKYVTDRVYVGARRDADTSSGAVEVEVEITPNISAEVETGTDDSQAAAVNWHWHY